MRLVMAMIVQRAFPKLKVDPRYSWKRLHRYEREIVNRMLRETKGNYLLYHILTWFGMHYNVDTDAVADAVDWVRKNISYHMRHRKEYPEEYKLAKADWIEFSGKHWPSDTDSDKDQEAERIIFDRRGKPPRMVLDQMNEHRASFDIEYIRSSSYVDEDDYPTEEYSDSEDDESDESESEDSSEDDVPLKVCRHAYHSTNTSNLSKNIFTEAPRMEGKTRSGQVALLTRISRETADHFQTNRSYKEEWGEFAAVNTETDGPLVASQVESSPARSKSAPKPILNPEPKANATPAKASLKSAMKLASQLILESETQGHSPKPKDKKGVTFAAPLATLEPYPLHPPHVVQPTWQHYPTIPAGNSFQQQIGMPGPAPNWVIMGHNAAVANTTTFIHESQESVSNKLRLTKTYGGLRKLLPATPKPATEGGFSDRVSAMALPSKSMPTFPSPQRGVKRKADKDLENNEDGL